MKKVIALSVLSALLLSAMLLSSCISKAPEASIPSTTSENAESDPLSEELKKQIVEDFVAYELGDDYVPREHGIFRIERYYGSYDGAVAVMLNGAFDFIPEVRVDKVADSEIYYAYGTSIQVWKDGKFFTMREAYEQGILTAEQVAEIANAHSYSEKLNNCILDLNDITKEAIEDAFAEDGDRNRITWFDINEENGEWDGVRCYGSFESCIILFEPGDLTVESEITVADSKFEYPNSFGLYGYYDGELYTLSEAFENGYISKDEVAVVAERHRTVQRHINSEK